MELPPRDQVKEAEFQRRLKYYMPLDKVDLDDLAMRVPGPSIFSVPKAQMQYSKETQDLVKLLAEESALTVLQRNGFASILRSGSSLPSRPQDLARNYLGEKAYFRKRHAEKARALGLELMDKEATQKNSSKNHVPCQRRSLSVIKASGELEPTPLRSQKCNLIDKEKQKDQLAHKMAYGRNSVAHEHLSKGNKVVFPQREKSIEEMQQERLQDRNNVYEDFLHTISNSTVKAEFNTYFCEFIVLAEIDDRAKFYKSMEHAGQGKAYKPMIVGQIKEKLDEVRRLCAPIVPDIIQQYNLGDIDERILLSYTKTPKNSFLFHS